MARKFGKRRSLSLPWERRGFLRLLLSGQRWKAVVAGIAALLLLVGGLRSARYRQQVRTTRSTLARVKRALGSFRSDLGRCPHSVREMMHPPRSGRRYLREIPLDGWGTPLWVRCPGRYDPEGADVFSAGPSGSFLVDDNIQ